MQAYEACAGTGYEKISVKVGRNCESNEKIPMTIQTRIPRKVDMFQAVHLHKELIGPGDQASNAGNPKRLSDLVGKIGGYHWREHILASAHSLVGVDDHSCISSAPTE